MGLHRIHSALPSFRKAIDVIFTILNFLNSFLPQHFAKLTWRKYHIYSFYSLDSTLRWYSRVTSLNQLLIVLNNHLIIHFGWKQPRISRGNSDHLSQSRSNNEEISSWFGQSETRGFVHNCVLTLWNKVVPDQFLKNTRDWLFYSKKWWLFRYLLAMI